MPVETIAALRGAGDTSPIRGAIGSRVSRCPRRAIPEHREASRRCASHRLR